MYKRACILDATFIFRVVLQEVGSGLFPYLSLSSMRTVFHFYLINERSYRDTYLVNINILFSVHS